MCVKIERENKEKYFNVYLDGVKCMSPFIWFRGIQGFAPTIHIITENTRKHLPLMFWVKKQSVVLK